ncbi:MAG TPA: amino acid adenylation domain-containing protein, partial [Armatimonadota bacterium]|nr:amino acid adenylation domain-containing protein [Armatimonadota bacterium]
EAAAVACGDVRLTYGELERRANIIAHRLRERGVRAETVVGLAMERGVEQVVGLLGVLKAGGAYLPLDPDLPAERLLWMMEDGGVEVLLTQARVRGRLPRRENESRVVLIDESSDEIEVWSEERVERVQSGLTGDNLAYIIYTSGSTGRPKGVMVQHRSLLNLLQGLTQAVYAHCPERPLRVSLNASLSFDASVQQLLSLLLGHTLYVIPQDIRADGHAVLAYLGRHEIDVFDCTPSQLSLLLSAGLLEVAAARRPSVYLVGGEAIDAQMWQTLSQAGGGESFYNVYGPTECTVDALATRIAGGAGRPHIGRPLANTRVYLLDAAGEPVGVGINGELYLGGEGVARGYLRRAELTAERFVPDRFGGEAGGRLYRTGDIGRYLDDGNIEYLGRVDNQVKVRGYRIELGEIEAALVRHESVCEVAVTVREDVPGNKRLVAYVVAAEDGASPVNELREYLRQQLPEYMIPSTFVMLEEMPLTPNGKIDRRALPAPEETRGQGSDAYLAPRTPMEEMLADIFADVLRVAGV